MTYLTHDNIQANKQTDRNDEKNRLTSSQLISNVSNTFPV